MAAPKGNKNNEKWTLEKSEQFLNDVYNYVLEHEDCCSISEACAELGWYETLFEYLIEKFSSIEFEPIKKAKELVKKRIIKKGLKNEYNPTMSIFILKCNHEMKETTDPPKTPDNYNITFIENSPKHKSELND